MLHDVSVVIVNWNGARYLDACLRSLGDAAEVVMVDNGSADGSVELVRQQFPSVVVVENGRNLGFSAANNIGHRACRSAYVLFLNNDTVVREGALPSLRAAFDRDPRLGIAGARLEGTDGRPQPGSIGRLPSFRSEARRILSGGSGAGARDDFDYDRPQEVAAVCGAALMARRNVLDEVGGWPEEYFAYAEDADLCRRVAARGYGVWYESGARIMHVHGASGKHLGLAGALRAQLISHRSLNRFIRRYEGNGAALAHALLLPLDLVLRGVRRLARGG